MLLHEKRIWGVTLRKEKPLGIRKRFLDPEGGINSQALLDAQRDGLPTEAFLPGGYLVQLFVRGKIFYVGKRPTATAAGRLFDSALFHLWGFLKNPKPRFNNYTDSTISVSTPLMEQEVERLRSTLRYYFKDVLGSDPDLFDYNYNNRPKCNTHPITTK